MRPASPNLVSAETLRRHATNLAIARSAGAELAALDDALLRALAKMSAQRLRRAMASPLSIQNDQDNALPISAVFIRPVGDRCNLACSYCYQAHLREEAVGKRMTFQTLRDTLANASKLPTRPISFAWHGGEPLLAGKAFFRKAIELQCEFFPSRGEVTNSVQTSGVLLDDEWLELFQRSGFAVGISLDGPRDLHDSQRFTKSGIGTFETLLGKIARARELNVPLNAICVIGEHHFGQAARVFDTFLSLGIVHCNLQPDFGNDGAGRPTHVSAKSFAEFTCAFWDLWKNSPPPYIRVRFFDNFLVQLLNGQGDDCVFSGECSRLIAVSETGGLRPCSRPIEGYADMGSIALLATSGAGAPVFSQFRAEDMLSQSRAAQCPYFKMCNHGCPQHRINEGGEQSVSGSNVFCGCSNAEGVGYDTIWAHMLIDVCETLSDVT